jgi:hypothetical protein
VEHGSFARGGITIGCSILHRTRIRIGQIYGRQALSVLGLAGPAGAGLLLATGEIFAKLGSGAQAALFLGRTQLRFSTAALGAFLGLGNARLDWRSLLVFQWVCHDPGDSGKRAATKGPSDRVLKLRHKIAFRLALPDSLWQ